MQTVIFGKNVSKSARSPKLWNLISDYYQIESRMICVDSEEKDFQQKFELIEKKEHMIGGLLGSPLKSHFLINKYQQTLFSKKIFAANCFYKKFNSWIFDNFDGTAAVDSIKYKFDLREFKNIFIIGSGPVARAILQTLNKEDKRIYGNTFIISRGIKNISNTKSENYNFLITNLKYKNLIINATPLGSVFNNVSPISFEDFQNINSLSLYFDANYGSHKPIGCKYSDELRIENLDGSDMNLRQAILGYIAVHSKYNSNLSFDETYDYLSKCDL